MSVTTSCPSAAPTARVVAALLPLIAVVLVIFLVTGLAIPALPLHVHERLGLGTFVVGLVSGAQFAASLVSRIWSGRYADRHGAKRAVVAGLAAAAASGLLYILSLALLAAPTVSVVILLAGRALLGGAESFIITGALSWGLALVEAQNAGKVIAWLGTALYAAFAVGAPAGTLLYGAHGLFAIGLATACGPLVVLPLIAAMRAIEPLRRPQPRLAAIAAAVALPGAGLTFASLGFAAVTTFVTLLFAANGWRPVWLGITAFATAFMLTRIAFGHLPDRIGGARAAFVSVFVEAAGLALIWLAPLPGVAFAGAVLTGAGYALVYPGLGIEAVRRVPPQSRGLAMGTYTAFFDLGIAVASPALGLVAGQTGLGAVFLASALVVLGAGAVAVRLLRD
ncbi:MAG TPA: arabinose transporter [Stellaceae bacterium]|nr:arabinose transporter [Stellaceae bacterium]